MSFEVQLNKKISEIETIIMKYMPMDKQLQEKVIDAMYYTMLAGGKRIRPLFMYEVYKLFKGSSMVIEPFLAAIEMIHTYSLIHDDLPALDNDDYRRGKKTAHIVYGEAMAILAGDSLLNYAFETVSKAFDMIDSSYDIQDTNQVLKELTARRNIDKAVKLISAKPGIYGMIGGQVADVELTGTKLSKDQLIYIYKNKTAALIEAAMMIGATLAGASDEDVNKMEKVAYNIGMAFQIQDDILDQISTFEELGKPIHSDEKNEKITFVSLYGVEKSEDMVKHLSNEANIILQSIDGDSEFLVQLVNALITRKN